METFLPQNIKHFRNACQLTQEQVATFLGIERGTFSNYELGSREVPIDILLRLSNLYGVELNDFYETDHDKLNDSLTCAFRISNLQDEDITAIATFKDIVKSYLKMNRLQND